MDDNKWCPGFKCLSREARRYTEQKLVQGEIHGKKHRGTITSLSMVGAGPWGWWRRNKCCIAILSREGGGGGVIVIHNRGVMEGEGECKSFSRR